ncbi:Uncharacterized protein YlbG, UPF0298 family [Alteribacillus persepolensis]|uniref:UPF0298 protein SAMN05192534_10195 n=1 Tax=Alteribacillus persepolensis TaxID=568899 RepID=A0A1G7YES1_9BACI|nr:DUF2129 domain-containing protein [Alteribacillus persepolensis]SDG94410.1 Uncharacterized protein YlbG, UPF0298 family [Alteribacillus persepolensis]
MFQERAGMAVWLHSVKLARQLRKYGVVHYVSKRMKYAVVYCNKSDIEQTVQSLEALPFVKKVEPSMKPDISTEFSGPVHPREKQFDYNVGI